MFGRVARRLRADGPAGLLYAVADRIEDWRDARFDRRFGIETGAEPGHQPIQSGVFRSIARALSSPPRELSFIDYGCGKGRALVLAAELGFARIEGVELVPALHAKAVSNLERYRAGRPAAPPVSLHLGDAAEFEPRHDRAVLFFYNPFDDVVLGRVLARLEARWREGSPDWILVYRTALHARLMRDSRWLVSVTEEPAFSIWRTRVLHAGAAAGRRI